MGANAIEGLEKPYRDVSARLATDVWATGEDGPIHFDGTAWYRVSEPGMPSTGFGEVVAMPNGDT